jgi:hypothetical protein
MQGRTRFEVSKDSHSGRGSVLSILEHVGYSSGNVQALDT